MFVIPTSLRFRKGINNRPALSRYAKQCSRFSSFASSTIKNASSGHIGSSPFKTFGSYNTGYRAASFYDGCEADYQGGSSVDHIFNDLPDSPAAAATMAQVHKAVLPDDEVAAVKVHRQTYF